MKILFLTLFLFLFKIGLSQNNPLRDYFVANNVLLPSQLSLFDSFTVSMKRSYLESMIEAIQQAKTAEEKKMYENALKRIEQESNVFGLQTSDTLNSLLYYLIPSCRGSLSISATGLFANYQDTLQNNFSRVSPDSLIYFLRSVRNAGLISVITEDRTKKLIIKREIIDTFSVLKSAIDIKEHEKFYTLERVSKFLAECIRMKIITKEAAKDISSLAEKYELIDNYQILQRCNKVAIVDLNEYPDYPQDYMLPVYRKIASILPNLSFDSFSVKVETYRESYDTSLQYRTLVSLTSNGKKYSNSDFYSPSDYDKDGHPDNEWKTGDNIEAIFNKILRDNKSSYRIHSVNRIYSPNEDDSGKIGFIALTKSQAESLHSNSFFTISYQSFNESITSSKIEDAIQLYQRIGLLNHLSKGAIDSCIQSISGKEINYYSDILSSFKSLVFEIDLEYGIDVSQYKKLTQEIAAISKGRFNPIDIIDTYDFDNQKKFDYGFTLNGKKYLAKLYQEDDWLDPGFWELIEKAMNEQDREGKFFNLYPNDGIRQIYLTHKQAEILKNNKMIELEESDIKD